MKYAFAILLLIALSVHAENPIDKGSMKIGGGLSLRTTEHDGHKRSYLGISPQVDYFINRNFGVGLHTYYLKGMAEYWDFHELRLKPSFTFIAEKPSWPPYVSVGPALYKSFHRFDDPNEWVTGWFIEIGIFIFLNDNVALVPLFEYTKGGDDFYDSTSDINFGFAYFFHR